MTDARMPERWLADRRFLRLSDAAYRLYHTALLWSVANGSDGVIFDDDLRLLPVVDAGGAAELGEAGLWRRAEAGMWVIDDYARTQTSRHDLEVLENERQRQRAKGRRYRAARSADPPPQPVDNQPGSVDNPVDNPGHSVDNPVDNPAYRVQTTGTVPGTDSDTVPGTVPGTGSVPGTVPVTRTGHAPRTGQVVLEVPSTAPLLPQFVTDSHVRAPAREADDPPAKPRTAQTLVGEWLDRCAERPPSRIVGQVAKELAKLLAENIAYRHVRQGLIDWHHAAVTGHGLHPATLPSFVHTAQAATNGRASPRENMAGILAEQPEALRSMFRSPP